MREIHSRLNQAANDLRRGYRPAQRSYRDRSPIFPGLFQVRHQFFKTHHWVSWRRPAARVLCRCDVPLSDRFSPSRVGGSPTDARTRRNKLGHHAVAVGDKHRLAARGQADVFAELVLEDFDADRAHDYDVATGSYFVNPGAISPCRTATRRPAARPRSSTAPPRSPGRRRPCRRRRAYPCRARRGPWPSAPGCRARHWA